MPSRRKSREFVLQVLFAADARDQDPLETFDFLGAYFSDEQDEDLKMHRVLKDFARNLVKAVSENKDAIDALIALLSHNWKLSRISRVDRNILRMAIAEFTQFHDIPNKVILNEAIEIGKKFGAENSAAFINGILDRVNLVDTRPNSVAELLEILQEVQ